MARLRYGLRRYPLLVAMFLGAAGLIGGFASQLEKPAFIFPFGRLPPDEARLVLFGVAALLVAYVAAQTFVRFAIRPAITIQKKLVILSVGEFGRRKVSLTRDDVLQISVLERRQWKGLVVRHRAGVETIWSSHLASDEDFERLKTALEKLSL